MSDSRCRIHIEVPSAEWRDKFYAAIADITSKDRLAFNLLNDVIALANQNAKGRFLISQLACGERSLTELLVEAGTEYKDGYAQGQLHGYSQGYVDGQANIVQAQSSHNAGKEVPDANHA